MRPWSRWCREARRTRRTLSDGDIIEAIGNQDTRDLSLAMIQLLLEGAAGKRVEMAVIAAAQGGAGEDELNRVSSSAASGAETMYENSSILYLKPMVLDHEHVQQMESKLKAMNKAGNKKILLDLRDVAAGDMAEATRLANFFLKSGTIASLEGQKLRSRPLRPILEGDQYDGAAGSAGEPRNRWPGGAGGGAIAG
jgi:carboxyl-terminal processing protease